MNNKFQISFRRKILDVFVNSGNSFIALGFNQIYCAFDKFVKIVQK